MKREIRTVLHVALLTCGVAVSPASAGQQDPFSSVFEEFDSTTPGCAVGVDHGDKPPEFRVYGLADLEHGVPNSIDTVFEAGSVSKQFTAVAVLKLVEDGKISLQDDVRQYFPELSELGAYVSIAMLLNHTSGLRDWGDIQTAAGWPRGDRLFTLQSVLDIIAAQKGLNYEPNTDWSYTNSGYNLAAILVERVSGKSLADFTRERLFEPLDMTHTRWRDDYRTVVPGRAIAYQKSGSGYLLNMPFENAYGNGGLLTTVGDLLIWNRALTEGKLGKFVDSKLSEPTYLEDGRTVDYRYGLFIESHGEVREISHSGYTAGYSAWLARYPDRQLSIAILCNEAGVPVTAAARKIADLYLPESGAVSPVDLSDADQERLRKYAGWYVYQPAGIGIRFVFDNGRLRIADGPYIKKVSDDILVLESQRFRFTERGTLLVKLTGLDVEMVPAGNFEPDQIPTSALTGEFYSPELRAHYSIFEEDQQLKLRIMERPENVLTLQPTYEGAFNFGGTVLRYEAGPEGTIDTLVVSSSRIWGVRMSRIR